MLARVMQHAGESVSYKHSSEQTRESELRCAQADSRWPDLNQRTKWSSSQMCARVQQDAADDGDDDDEGRSEHLHWFAESNLEADISMLALLPLPNN